MPETTLTSSASSSPTRRKGRDNAIHPYSCTHYGMWSGMHLPLMPARGPLKNALPRMIDSAVFAWTKNEDCFS